MDSLYKELLKYGESDYYPLHMPGHKRRLGALADPFSFDITEIEGFDNLHHAEGILLEAQRRAARLYGSEETFFLVNGSTAGILSAIGACAPQGKLLMARNSHKAAYHGVYLNRLEAVYLCPETVYFGPERAYSEPETVYPEAGISQINGPISAEQVEAALEREPDVRAVFITSPTYDGVVSDVAGIARAAHRYGIPLVVDEAHGAHFGMHPIFPPSSVGLGADVVIHSLHKTLPSLTQTALLHVNGTLVDRGRLRKQLGIYQSSSPSYVLMASMDQCIRLLEERGRELFERFAGELERFWGGAHDYKTVRLLRTDDPSKILIHGGESGAAGLEISWILRRDSHLELEMAAGNYALALTSVADGKECFVRLEEALWELDKKLTWQKSGLRGGTQGSFGFSESRQGKFGVDEINVNKIGMEKKCTEKIWLKKNDTEETVQNSHRAVETKNFENRYGHEKKWTGQDCEKETVSPEEKPGNCMTIWEAENRTQHRIKLEESAGRISGEYVYLYPPGVPLVVPGERISDGMLRQLLCCKKAGYELQGPEDYRMEYIRVVG